MEIDLRICNDRQAVQFLCLRNLSAEKKIKKLVCVKYTAFWQVNTEHCVMD